MQTNGGDTTEATTSSSSRTEKAAAVDSIAHSRNSKTADLSSSNASKATLGTDDKEQQQLAALTATASDAPAAASSSLVAPKPRTLDATNAKPQGGPLPPQAPAAAPIHTPATAPVSTATEPKPSDFKRPAAALSQHVMLLFKTINRGFCQKKRMMGPGQKYNNGYDDKDGHYIVLHGEEIFERYTVQEVLGKGSFGTVVKCYDTKRQETVAVKISRMGLNFRNQAKLEIEILLKLNANQNLQHLVVRLLKVFDWQGHLVLVFELLSFNLYQLVKCTKYRGVSLDLVRKFAFQLLQVLKELEQMRPPIIHCDLKPENILLRSQRRSGIRVIDFGSACYENRKLFKYIQSRFYRSPEVILHLDYGCAIDRWSLGCVLVELHVGLPLFDGRTEVSQLERFEAVLGPAPRDFVEASPKKSKYYEDEAQADGHYRLRDAPSPEKRKSLAQIIGVSQGGPSGSRFGQVGHDEATYRHFLDFVEALLKYRPSDRMSCAAGLAHPFLAPMLAAENSVVTTDVASSSRKAA